MSVVKSFIIIGVAALLAFQECKNATPPEYQRLFRLPIDQQEAEFKKYPLEQQIDIYIEAMQGVEPPATQFGEFLASNGRKVIPLMLQRLKAEENDRHKYCLIASFEQMDSEFCSLKADKDVIPAIRQAISGIKDSGYKEMSEMSLNAIQNLPGAKSPC
jgi:hypothetical protein